MTGLSCEILVHVPWLATCLRTPGLFLVVMLAQYSRRQFKWGREGIRREMAVSGSGVRKRRGMISSPPLLLLSPKSQHTYHTRLK